MLAVPRLSLRQITQCRSARSAALLSAPPSPPSRTSKSGARPPGATGRPSSMHRGELHPREAGGRPSDGARDVGLQGRAAQRPAAEAAPPGVDPSRLVQQQPADGLAACRPVDHGPEIAPEMSPARLSARHPRVGREAVRDDHPVLARCLPRPRLQYLGLARAMDLECGRTAHGGDLEPGIRPCSREPDWST